MSGLVEIYEVTVRLPNGTVSKCEIHAMDHYTAQRIVETMTGGTAMGAAKVR